MASTRKLAHHPKKRKEEQSAIRYFSPSPPSPQSHQTTPSRKFHPPPPPKREKLPGHKMSYRTSNMTRSCHNSCSMRWNRERHTLLDTADVERDDGFFAKNTRGFGVERSRCFRDTLVSHKMSYRTSNVTRSCHNSCSIGRAGKWVFCRFWCREEARGVFLVGKSGWPGMRNAGGSTVTKWLDMQCPIEQVICYDRVTTVVRYGRDGEGMDFFIVLIEMWMGVFFGGEGGRDVGGASAARWSVMRCLIEQVI
jgi:hypothetical protein